MLVSACLSARIWVRVSLGIFAKASLVGANTVTFGALLRVSTRPAFVAAVTSVDKAGFCAAAVATGWSAMAARLPGPVAGTSGQAGPNGAVPAAGAELGSAARVVVSGAPLAPVAVLLQAARARAVVISAAAVRTLEVLVVRVDRTRGSSFFRVGRTVRAVTACC